MKKEISVQMVAKAVAKEANLTIRELKSHSRSWDVSRPRLVAMYLARDLTGKSLPEIGRYFSKDHTTVLYAVKKLETEMKQGGPLADMVRKVRPTLLQPSFNERLLLC